MTSEQNLQGIKKHGSWTGKKSLVARDIAVTIAAIPCDVPCRSAPDRPIGPVKIIRDVSAPASSATSSGRGHHNRP